ncbi:class A sortase [Lapidilactobacillus mulanensis]|uniref:Class A sortase n=2 Tax=Lapidilactobacillus mulanensis TaxID=2485999 RepID=A0ABW4DMU6_9LACO
MKKKLRIVLIVLLLVVGLILIFNQQIKDQLVAFTTQNKIEQVTKSKITKSKKAKASFDFDAVESVDTQQVVQAATQNDASALGKIAIPAVNLTLPIVKGVGETALATGAGTMKADQEMGAGNYALAGHHMNNPNILFSPVTRAQVGQLIYITDLTNVYVYKIDLKEVIKPTDVSIIDDQAGKKMITLITCAQSGTKRWAVQGQLQRVEKATKANLAVF